MKEEPEMMLETVYGPPIRYYIDANGKYIGGTDGLALSEYEVAFPPEYFDQIWDGSAWGESIYWLTQIENAWRESEIFVIVRQLEALEEEEAGVPPDDILPGTRTQWLAYRGKVRAWKEGFQGFPHQVNRPLRPAE
ncbi:hypothetical protein OH708_24100 [Pseudomonas capsici]|uniref:hypothetical protein n=1 Tax=Pseudomonas capsici TaxID=2810614 RepID=UPI0021F14C14|nr:hypothetical protein [Pseudomonas capsici]MCV4291003.1 hypothetical protein [Pseudomonas capsici]